MTDRSAYPTRKTTLRDTTGEAPISPEEGLRMVWQLTLQAWCFKEGRYDEPRLRRHVVRTVRDRI